MNTNSIQDKYNDGTIPYFNKYIIAFICKFHIILFHCFDHRVIIIIYNEFKYFLFYYFDFLNCLLFNCFNKYGYGYFIHSTIIVIITNQITFLKLFHCKLIVNI